MCRRLKGEEIPATEIEEQEQRSALGRLKGHGEHGKVGSVRIGSARVSGPGVMSTGPTKQPLKQNNGGAFKIFSDDKGSSGQSSGQRAGQSGSLPGKDDYKENQMAAGKWTGRVLYFGQRDKFFFNF